MYLSENYVRFKVVYIYVAGEFRVLGIFFLSRGVGFFIWVDLRKVCRWRGGWGESLGFFLVGEG